MHPQQDKPTIFALLRKDSVPMKGNQGFEEEKKEDSQAIQIEN